MFSLKRYNNIIIIIIDKVITRVLFSNKVLISLVLTRCVNSFI